MQETSEKEQLCIRISRVDADLLSARATLMSLERSHRRFQSQYKLSKPGSSSRKLQEGDVRKCKVEIDKQVTRVRTLKQMRDMLNRDKNRLNETKKSE